MVFSNYVSAKYRNLNFFSHFVSVFVFGCVGVEGQLSGPRIQHRQLDDPHCDFMAASGDISRPTPPGCDGG